MILFWNSVILAFYVGNHLKWDLLKQGALYMYHISFICGQQDFIQSTLNSDIRCMAYVRQHWEIKMSYIWCFCMKCKTAYSFPHPFQHVYHNKNMSWEQIIMPVHITFPAILALVRFQSPVPVHVFVEGLLSSESFSTFLTYKRPFTCVYSLVTFHVTYTKHTVEEDSFYYLRFIDSIIF